MSRQSAFNALGRELLESEKLAVAGFKAKYAALANAQAQVVLMPEPAAIQDHRDVFKRVVRKGTRSPKPVRV